jgi:hypothetical protein
MELKKRAHQAVGEIIGIVGGELLPEQRRAVEKVVEELLVDALRESAASTTQAATACCPEDEDMAHKIALEVKQAQVALVANLSSLR